MRILALDPGKTTGYALVDWDGESPKATLLVSGDLEGLQALGDMLWQWFAHADRPDLVIYETFRLYAHKAQSLVMDDFIAPQAIGIIKYLCELRRVPLKGQSASQGKGVTEAMVEERLDYWNTRPQSGHQRDACRHALAYILGEYNRRNK